MDRNLPGLSPLWIISLAMVLGTTIIAMIPVAVSGGYPIKSSDWIGFAGNVVAGAMTLVAAVAAWQAVQNQIRFQKEIEEKKSVATAARIKKEQAEAKAAAEVSLTQTVHAVAMMLYAVKMASTATKQPDRAKWDHATDQASAQVENTLTHFSLQQIAEQLELNDRLTFLIVLTRMSSIVNIYNRPPGILTRPQRLSALQKNLEKLHIFLKAFSTELADVYERDGMNRP